MSKTGFSLLDLSSLSEPATKLIDTVASGAGILYEPTRIRRKARAEADAAAILARGNEEVQEIDLRVAERFANNELRRQKNIESIVTQAVKALPDEVSSETVSEDWITQFFEYSQDIGDEQMQAVWARILAGEVAEPNSFSPRTLHLVRHLRQNEAAAFRTFCSYIFDDVHLVDELTAEYTKGFGLNFMTLKNLETIGLIDMGLSLSLDDSEDDSPSLSYFGKEFYLRKRSSEETNDKFLLNYVPVYLDC